MTEHTLKRITLLRAELKTQGVDGFIVAVGDEFLGEYVPPSAERLCWLTGFSGSAGMIAVLANDAALFVDGRYTLQAKQEVPEMSIRHFNIGDKRPEVWLAETMSEGMTLGFDPWLHSVREAERMEKALLPKKIALKALEQNPLDVVWKERPAAPASEVQVHALEFSGEDHTSKCARVGEALTKQGADAAVLVATDSINWLLNIRGRDVAYSPLALAYAVLEASGRVVLYISPERVNPSVCAHLVPGVEVREPARLSEDIEALGAKGGRVWVDPVLTPAWFAAALRNAGAEVVLGDDPVQKPKALKNATELAGIRAAHVRDGLALTRFLHWLEQNTIRKELTERDAAKRLLEFRASAPEFVSPSFETIAGSGPNGAIVHYRVTQHSNRVLHQDELFLLDSGGQYKDGTTDVTRTVVIGTPSAEHVTRFTQVLKGHIALATARFPEGTTGSQLDALARMALWQQGVDYDHGTGHGVGAFLNVHEGPQRISKRGSDTIALAPGMVISNEPGYYKEGAYGIRIENLVTVIECGVMENGRKQLGFDTLTCAPIDLRLVDSLLLTRQEIMWLNSYHAWVYKTHAPSLSEEEKGWLSQVTRALS